MPCLGRGRGVGLPLGELPGREPHMGIAAGEQGVSGDWKAVHTPEGRHRAAGDCQRLAASQHACRVCRPGTEMAANLGVKLYAAPTRSM